jgi:hypothetical protein
MDGGMPGALLPLLLVAVVVVVLLSVWTAALAEGTKALSRARARDRALGVGILPSHANLQAHPRVAVLLSARAGAH